MANAKKKTQQKPKEGSLFVLVPDRATVDAGDLMASLNEQVYDVSLDNIENTYNLASTIYGGSSFSIVECKVVGNVKGKVVVTKKI